MFDVNCARRNREIRKAGAQPKWSKENFSSLADKTCVFFHISQNLQKKFEKISFQFVWEMIC
jgi:hypothetical protein